ncbi:MAG TPA: asparaginase [Blastocatellia bacterium]
MPKKRIYIVYTGGTIGMVKTPDGYTPAPGNLEREMAQIRKLSDPTMPDYTVHQYDPLLDSANITPADWTKIARDIEKNYDDYDGFVVLHGTDTMAYTASALPFMFQGFQKPVILTGSQIPLCEVRNDGRENLITSLLIAANYPIKEVCLYFGNRLLRGCRAVKKSADGFDAFESPNFPPLGTVGVDIEINEPLLAQPSGASALRVREIREAPVCALRLFPGISAQLVRRMLQSPLQGLILEAYGVGNGPDHDQEFLDTLREATSRGVVIVVCTQCLSGTINLAGYRSGSALAKAGVISGHDMTPEAALAKMLYLFSQGHSAASVKEKMGQNLRNELTPSKTPQTPALPVKDDLAHRLA